MKATRRLSYDKMCGELLDQIRSGELAPGAALPSENQLALKYAICRSSVRTGLLSLEQDFLIGRQAGKGWFVRLQESGMLDSNEAMLTRFYTIAADLNLLAVPWYHQIIFNGIRDACNAHEVRQVFYDTENLSSMRKGFCDGLICAQTGIYKGMQENPLLARLPELGIQPVVVNRFYENPKIGYVSCDYLAESQKGAQFLKRMGHDKLAYISADQPSNHIHSARSLGVSRIYSQSQITRYPMPEMKTHLEYSEVLLNQFRENGIPDVFYLENGSFCSPLFRTFRQMGISADHSPVVFCFDDISYLQEFYEYPAYYLSMPLKEMMKDAVSYLVRKTNDPSVPVLKKIYRAEIKTCNLI